MSTADDTTLQPAVPHVEYARLTAEWEAEMFAAYEARAVAA